MAEFFIETQAVRLFVSVTPVAGLFGTESREPLFNTCSFKVGRNRISWSLNDVLSDSMLQRELRKVRGSSGVASGSSSHYNSSEYVECGQEILGQRMDKVGAEIVYLSSEDVLEILCKRNESNPSLLWFFVISSVLIDLPCDQHPGT